MTAAALLREAPRQPAFERAALVTLFTVFLYADRWTSRLADVLPLPVVIGGTLAVIAAAIAFRCQRRPAFWLALAGAMFAALLGTWWTTDDHVFLIAYWVLALGLAALEEDPAAALARHARLLLGLVFLFAALWKLLSWSYVSGGMFHYQLLVDPRFARLTQLTGAVSAADLAANFAHVDALRREALPGATLTSAPIVGTLAAILTWATLAIEGSLAALFLLPERTVPAWVRDGVFLSFLVGTYLLAPVLLFGVLLVAMGIAQARPRAATAYLVALVWVYLMAVFFSASFAR